MMSSFSLRVKVVGSAVVKLVDSDEMPRRFLKGMATVLALPSLMGAVFFEDAAVTSVLHGESESFEMRAVDDSLYSGVLETLCSL